MRRFLSVLLALALLLGALPGAALAADRPEGTFVLAAMTKDGFIIEPEYAPYTPGQSVMEALLSGSHTFTGLETGFLSLLAAQLLAVLAAIVLLVTKRAKWKDSLPFAPFLWAGLLLCLCLGITY